MVRRAAILVLVALGWPAQAAELSLSGPMMQGGLVVGRTAPGTSVRLGERRVRVAKDGGFLIGFGRDAPPHATLALTGPDGVTDRRRLTVTKRDYDIQRIDGLPPKKVTPPAAALKRIRAESALVAKARRRDTTPPGFRVGFVWPARGRLSGVYGSQRVLNGKPRRPHFGVDVAAPVGTPVVAAAAGAVSLAQADLYFSGGTVLIDHGFGLSTAYLHMDTVTVKTGQQVRQGQKIGTIGATGRVTGAHLDWRLNLFDTRLDPQLLVPSTPPPLRR